MTRHWTILTVVALLCWNCAGQPATDSTSEQTYKWASAEISNGQNDELAADALLAYNDLFAQKTKDLTELLGIAFDVNVEDEFKKQARKMLLRHIGGRTPVIVAGDTVSFKTFLKNNQPGHFSNIRILNGKMTAPFDSLATTSSIIEWEETVNKGVVSETWTLRAHLMKKSKLLGTSNKQTVVISYDELKIE